MRPLAIAFLIAAPIFAQNLTTLIDDQLSGLLEIYKDLHSHPELSHQESRTSALLANELRKAGYTVTERVGSAARLVSTPSLPFRAGLGSGSPR